MQQHQNQGKGQAAIEYMMNYVWAIALVIIGVTALFALDIGGLQTAISTSGSDSGFQAQFQHVAVPDHRLSDCGDTGHCILDINLKNNGDQRVNITDITVLELDDNTVSTTHNESGTCSFGIDLFPGDSTTCTGINFSSPANKETGDPYDLRITLNYTVLDFDGNTLFFQAPERVIRGQIEAK